MAFAPIMFAVAAAMTAFSKITEGYSQARQANEQAQASSYNAVQDRQLANATTRSAAAQEAQVRRESDQELGTQFAAASEAGIGLQGSAADIMRQSRANAEMNALNVRYRGALERTNYLNAAQLEDYQAAVSRQNSSNAKFAGFLGAGTSLLSSAGTYASATSNKNYGANAWLPSGSPY